jgi:xanthine/uracil/vitamin C permease (AzgA family)
MAREVDRLLAQLAGGGRSAPTPASRPAAQRGITRVSSSGVATSSADHIALWTRVGLGTTLGGLMTQWPYAHACGWPLAAYLGAVAVVVLAGIWIGLVSWKLRSGAAHLLAGLLLFWGLVLSAERVLPRIGYAAEHATWQCFLAGG